MSSHPCPNVAQIGLVAHASAGKETALNIFQKYGYKTFNFSRVLKDIGDYFQEKTPEGNSRFDDIMGIQNFLVEKFGPDVGTREKLEDSKRSANGIFVLEGKVNTANRFSLRDIGDAIRDQFGRDILSVGALEWIKKQDTERVVLEGIRIPEEAKRLTTAGIYLVGIQVDEEKRKEYMFNRKRIGDETEDRVIFEKKFAELQAREGAEIEECLRLCDKLIPNNTLLYDFETRIEELAYIRERSYAWYLGYNARK